MKIGYIGLGIMGRPCALNLLKAGYAVGVWARNAQQVIQLRAAGASVYESPAMLAQSVDVLFTNLPDTPDVELVALGENGIIQSKEKTSTGFPSRVEVNDVEESLKTYEKVARNIGLVIMTQIFKHTIISEDSFITADQNDI